MLGSGNYKYSGCFVSMSAARNTVAIGTTHASDKEYQSGHARIL